MPSLIAKGISESSRKKLVEIASTHARRQRATDEQAALAQGARIETAQKHFREAFWKEIDKHPEGSKIRAGSNAAANALKTLISEKPNRGALEKGIKNARESLDDIERRYRSAITGAAKSAIDEDKYLAGVLKALKREPAKLKKKRFGGFSMLFNPAFDLSQLRFPTQTSFALEPPFDQHASVVEQTSVLLGLGPSSSTDAESGLVLAFSNAADLGYQMGRAQVGGFLTIPPGFSTLTLQARILDVSAQVLAFALGAGWASSGGIAEVTSITSNSTIRHETSINYVVAPLFFYAEDDFSGPHTINAEFPISSNGGEILVTAGLKCDTWAAVVAVSSATATGTVSKINVKVS